MFQKLKRRGKKSLMNYAKTFKKEKHYLKKITNY